MRFKILPVTLVDLPYRELNGWPLSGNPTFKGPRLGVDDPIRLNPVQNVIVWGEQHHLPSGVSPPPCLLKRLGADPGYLPVHHGGELVDDDFLGLLADDPGQTHTELLTVGQHPEGAQPGGNRAQTDICQGPGHFVEVPVWGDAVNHRLVRGPSLGVVVDFILPEDGASDGGLAGAGRPHHDTDAPFPGKVCVDLQVEVAAVLRIEQALHSGRPVAVEVADAVVDLYPCHTVTTRQS